MEKDSSYFSDWKELYAEFLREREQYIIKIEQEKNETRQMLSELERYAPYKQNEIILNAKDLDLFDLKEIAPRIFNHPYLTGMVKRAFLEILVEKKDDTEYVFPWFNENKKIIPEKRNVFDQSVVLCEIKEILGEKVEKNPELYEPVLTEMINDLLFLYPFIEEVVTDVEFWVDSYLTSLDSSDFSIQNTAPETKEQAKMNDWLKKLNALAQRNND